jgi:ElaB/YqjD/DUF883 family membrane-anchored ribosome-binding protein
MADTETQLRSSPGEQSPAAQAKEQVQEVAGQAREKVAEVSQQARGRVQEQLDKRSSELAGQITSTAGDLRTVGEELRRQGKDTPAKLTDQVADKAEQLGGYLERSDASTILSDVESWGRQRPWAVIAGGLAVGFVASRFLKASSSRRYDTLYGYRLPADQARRLNAAQPPSAPRSV